jgi:hypothetical protein
MILLHNLLDIHVNEEEKVDKTNEILLCCQSHLTYQDLDQAFDIVRRKLQDYSGVNKITVRNNFDFLFTNTLEHYSDFFVAIIKGILHEIDLNEFSYLVDKKEFYLFGSIGCSQKIGYVGPKIINTCDFIYCKLIRIHYFDITKIKNLSNTYIDIVSNYSGYTTKAIITKKND